MAAPKNKKGDEFTWVQREGTNAWTRDFSKPYKGKSEESKKEAPKKKKRATATTRKSTSAPKTSSRPPADRGGKREGPTRRKAPKASDAENKPKRTAASLRGMSQDRKGPSTRGSVKTVSGIGADMKPQQRSSNEPGMLDIDYWVNKFKKGGKKSKDLRDPKNRS